jgi:hypothetical protein
MPSPINTIFIFDIPFFSSLDGVEDGVDDGVEDGVDVGAESLDTLVTLLFGPV